MSSTWHESRLHPAVLGVGAALGAAGVLAATHLTKGWCPGGTVGGAKPAGCCPMTGRKSAAAAAAASSGKRPMVVTVTGAAGQIGYAILFQIAQGRMLGADQPIELRLLDLPLDAPQQILKGVAMELEDCAFPLLHKVVTTGDLEEAFKGCEIALLIGARPRGPGMDRADLLKANADIFKKQGAALNQFASRQVKVLVVGNPANTNAKIAMEHAPDLPKSAFSAMTRLDQIRAVAQLASKLNCNVGDISNVVVWGNHSDTQFPDLTFAKVRQGGVERPALDLVPAEWARGPYIQSVQSRGGLIIKTMSKSSAASAANAAVQHVRSWWLGTAPGEWVSMAVASAGEYGVPKDLIFSFPVTCQPGGHFKIVEGLDGRIDDFGRAKLKTSWEQLNDEDQGWRGSAQSAAASS